jgi:ribosomal protein L9
MNNTRENTQSILEAGIAIYENYKKNKLLELEELDEELEEKTKEYNLFKKQNKEDKKFVGEQLKDIEEYITKQTRELLRRKMNVIPFPTVYGSGSDKFDQV